MQIDYARDYTHELQLKDTLIRNLERWIQCLDSSKRYGTPLSQDGIVELKELMEKALERIKENEAPIQNL